MIASFFFGKGITAIVPGTSAIYSDLFIMLAAINLTCFKRHTKEDANKSNDLLNKICMMSLLLIITVLL